MRYCLQTIATAWALVLVTDGLPEACTRDPFPVVRASIYFIAVTLPEVIDTGADVVRCARIPVGPCNLRSYGQRVRVSRIGGSDAPRARSGLEASNGIAFLVPWGDSPSCEPIGSNDPSPTWEPTKRGIFVGDLRPSDAWVQGTPTVDIHPAFLQPYPHALFFERGWMGTRLPGPGDLSIDQYWSLYEALPDSAALDRDKTSALLPLRRWAREHPSWAKRYPAPEILDRVRWHLLKNEGRFP